MDISFEVHNVNQFTLYDTVFFSLCGGVDEV